MPDYRGDLLRLGGVSSVEAFAAKLASDVAAERARAVAILNLPGTASNLSVAIQCVSDGTSLADARSLLQA